MIDSFYRVIDVMVQAGAVRNDGRRLVAVLVMLFAFGLQPRLAFSQVAARDGQHDFDFNFGVWKTHIRRVPDPFSEPSKSVELNGTVTVRKVWGGRGQLEEIEADGPKGHWEGLTTFLYNPQAHQWTQSFIDSSAAELTTPLIGDFKDGRGELFAEETFHGKTILIRGVWSEITPDAHHFEEDYSNNGGKTWAPTFIAELYRVEHPVVKDNLAMPSVDSEGTVAGDPQHAFDFDIGTWKTHSTRLLHPLTGSTEWMDMDGTSVVKKVWDGRANLAEYAADGPAGHVELLALRWFNPTTKEWNIDFATPGGGTLGIPGVGEFKDGRATFYDYEMIGGRSVLVRFAIWSIGRNAAQSEQAFSVDGGKTWEVNWVNKYTRIVGS